MEKLAQILRDCFKSPVHFMGAVVIAAALTVGLWNYPPFAKAAADPYWRFALMFAMLAAGGLVIHAGVEIVSSYKKWNRRRNLGRQIASLTADEKAILLRYQRTRKRTLAWEIKNGTVASLRLRGYLYQVSNIPYRFEIPHDINEDVWKYINQHPESVEYT